MKVRLGDVSRISFGLYQKARKTGDIPYLQVSQFDKNGLLKASPWEHFVPFSGQTEAGLLKPGQLVLAAKGFRHLAWAYQPRLGPMVPSSVFFVIEPDQKKVISEYLTIFLNLPRQQALFQSLGAGTNIPSIRKGELSNLRITIPPLNVQHQIVNLNELHQQEMNLLNTVREKKKALHQSVVQHLIYR